jgi:hypothetical protein
MSVRVPCEKTRKNMKIPVWRYVSWKLQCSEMSSWYGGIEERRKVWVKKEIVEHFSCYTISLKHF